MNNVIRFIIIALLFASIIYLVVRLLRNSGSSTPAAAGSSTPAAAVFDSSKWYNINNDNFCVYNNNDGRTGLYNCNRTYTDQHMNFMGVQNGAHMIKSKHSNRCLYHSSDGRFGWFPCNSDYGDQHWKFNKLNGKYTIQSVVTGKCLDRNNMDQNHGDCANAIKWDINEI